MGKTAQCLKMLSLLSTRNLIQASELASLLETNSRNIIEYKKELQELGYNIISVPGRYGGYKLDSNEIIPILKLTNEEKQCLIDTFNYCESKEDYFSIELLRNLVTKIMMSNHFEFINDNIVYIKDNKYNSMKAIYDQIYNAITSKNTVEIVLKKSKIRLNPYKLILSNNNWIVVGWNVNTNDVEDYLIKDIIDINATDYKFRVYKYFNINQYIKKFN